MDAEKYTVKFRTCTDRAAIVQQLRDRALHRDHIPNDIERLVTLQREVAQWRHQLLAAAHQADRAGVTRARQKLRVVVATLRLVLTQVYEEHGERAGQ